jgi:hypothetical protein
MFFTNGLEGLENQIERQQEEEKQQIANMEPVIKTRKAGFVLNQDDQDDADLGSFDSESDQYSLSSIGNIEESITTKSDVRNELFTMPKN